MLPLTQQRYFEVDCPRAVARTVRGGMRLAHAALPFHTNQASIPFYHLAPFTVRERARGRGLVRFYNGRQDADRRGCRVARRPGSPRDVVLRGNRVEEFDFESA